MWFQLWGGTSSTVMSLTTTDMLLLSDIVPEAISKTSIYPNPVTGSSFFINPGSDLINQNVTVKVTDMSGRLILSKNFVNAAGRIEVQLPASVVTGIYNVSVNNGYVSKLVIQK